MCRYHSSETSILRGSLHLRPMAAALTANGRISGRAIHSFADAPRPSWQFQLDLGYFSTVCHANEDMRGEPRQFLPPFLCKWAHLNGLTDGGTNKKKKKIQEDAGTAPIFYFVPNNFLRVSIIFLKNSINFFKDFLTNSFLFSKAHVNVAIFGFF